MKSIYKISFVLVLLLGLSSYASAQYVVNFEGETEVKPSYASGTVNLSGLDWDMTEALIGNSDSDWKNGLKSARLRGYGTSVMSMLADKADGLGTLTFSYRRYGTDAQVEWVVEYSTNAGANWTQLGAAFTAPASNDVTQFSETLNVTGNVRIRIRATTAGTVNRRLNIDDIELTNYTGGGNIPPVISNIVRTPAGEINSSATVHVSANVTDSDGTVSLVQLKWGTTTGVYPNTISMNTAGGNNYSTASPIPAQTDGTTVYFVVFAEDNAGGTKTSAQQSYIVRDPQTTTLPYAEAFDTDFGKVYAYSKNGNDKFWTYSTSGYVYMNGFNTGVLEDDWLILPAFNMDIYEDVQLSFESWKRYGSEDDNNYFKLLYSTNYAGMGDPSSATWTELPFTQPTEEQVWTSSGMVDLNAISGTSVYIAIQYHYNVDFYRLWQVDNIQITGTQAGIITQWAFTNAGDLNPTTGSGTATLIGGVTQVAQADALRITTFPAQSTASGTAGLQLMLSTIGYQNIQLTFKHRSSGTMSRWAEVQYTTNGGASWQSAGNNAGGLSPHDTYYDFSFDLSTITAASNNAQFGLRIVSVFSPVAFDDGLGNSFPANTAYHRARVSGGEVYSGDGNWRFQDVTISGDVISGNVPVKLSFLNINNGTSPNVNTPFSATVQSVDANNQAANVIGNTTVTLSKSVGTGQLTGTLTGIIPAGSNTVVFNNLVYNTAENGVKLAANATAGMALEPAVSPAFNVMAVATNLAIVSFPGYGQVTLPLTAFTIEARRPDQTVDQNYTGMITISKLTGNGTMSGTMTKQAIAGVATFDDIAFDATGSYTIQATASGLSSATSNAVLIINQPVLTSILLPKYVVGNNPTNHRVPYAYRATISNLIPNATYKFINQVVTYADAANVSGAGNIVFIGASGNFYRSSGPSFTTPENHGEFTTDANGNYTGWFITEPTGNARFTPGNYVYMRIRINNGQGGTTAVNYLTTADSTLAIGMGVNPDALSGSGVYGKLFSQAKNFAVLYDNVAGTGRPLACTFIEDDGTSGTTAYPAFYQNLVDGQAASWGSIIPNTLPTGLRRVEVRQLSNGEIIPSETTTSSNGNWPYGINTVNPVVGPEALLITKSPDFTANATNVVPGAQVQFTDLTPGSPSSWSWSFQGGTPSTSTAQNPTVTYNNTGEFDVTLVVTTSFGTHTVTKTEYITVTSLPTANFTADDTTPAVGTSVTFTNTSTGQINSWAWTFQGGTPSSYNGQTPPPVFYNTAGSFNVSLTVTNTNGSNTKNMPNYITAGFPPVANFVANGSTTIQVGSTLAFTDQSTGNIDSWAWTFEGGFPGTSNVQNPTNIFYNNAGLFDVSLTVTNAFGSNTKLTADMVNAGNAPVADFSSTHQAFVDRVDYQFTDISTNNPTSWSWSLPGGNPSTSTAQNPVVSYTVDGTYNVSLTATNVYGSGNVIKTGYVVINLTDIGENQFISGFTARPNPTNGYIELRDVKAGNTLRIYSNNGQLLREIETNDSVIELNISDLPKGLILIQAIDPITNRSFVARILHQ